MTKRQQRIKFLASLPHRSRVAEIGVQRGYNAGNIIKHCSPKELYLIDCWEHRTDNSDYMHDKSNVGQKVQDEIYSQVKKAFRKSRNVHVIKGYSLDVIKRFDDKFFDWVYLDGDHSYSSIKSDLAAWWEKIKVGGYIAGHDFMTTAFCGVEQAVNEFLAEHSLKIALRSKVSDWAIRRAS